ncbi:MAG: putative hydrolase of the metallo-beta-lactamase superfamily [Acidobacteria bacterium]|nr:putative hydrolase of the metallo-beta-lactamase superfamily [Acidobacteriota bacterium]
MSNVLEIIPLGGIGEFGMNCMAVRYEDEMLILDAGMGFPEESAYGVDVSIPNFEFLEEYRDHITAIILTHGHEDHLGALPYLLKKFNVPVYCSHFTAGLAESKLEEHDLVENTLIHRVEPRDVVDVGVFSIEFIRVSHSLIDCFSLAIKTPVGTIIHTGDYKVDETPVIGEPIDLRSFRRYGQEGVLALLSDSTNATVPGRTPSERAVIPAFEEIFAEAPGRIIVAAFASSIHRLQIVLDTSQQFNRKVCVLGRSMIKNVEIADRLGYLDIPDGLMVSFNQAKQLRDSEIVYLVTGSQGEMRAALSQMATQSYKGMTIEEGDTVVLSARIIPGNERTISRMIGFIYKRGANIIEEKRRLVHVSGHASQEDIRIMTEAVRPKFVVPIHGEYRMLFRHKEFVKNHLGYAEENIILIENGDVLELDGERAAVVNKREIGRTFIDESGFEEIRRDTVRERRQMATDGMITLVITLNAETGELQTPPEIVSRGVQGLDTGNGFSEDAGRIVKAAITGASRDTVKDESLLKEHIRVELKRFIQKRTGGRPVIMPVIVQV